MSAAPARAARAAGAVVNEEQQDFQEPQGLQQQQEHQGACRRPAVCISSETSCVFTLGVGVASRRRVQMII